MAAQKSTPEDFTATLAAHGATNTAKIFGMSIRGVHQRRRRLERINGRPLFTPRETVVFHPEWLKYVVKNGTVLIGSDAHFWPGWVTTAHKAFVKFAEKLQPKIIVLNGDVLDGAGISRHPPIGWEDRPTLIQEIETCQERLGEIQRAAPNAKRIWSLGNHDARLETRLATVAPEFAKIHGVHLKDHFPYWEPCWAMCINDDVVVKHRHKGGIHAVHNSTLWAGKSMVTGHLHSLKVSPLTDYNGTRYGVDSGCLAEPYSAPFIDYCEMNPMNWRSGFVVLTFKNGQLLWPEVVAVFAKGKVQFRGEIITV